MCRGICFLLFVLAVTVVLMAQCGDGHSHSSKSSHSKSPGYHTYSKSPGHHTHSKSPGHHTHSKSPGHHTHSKSPGHHTRTSSKRPGHHTPSKDKSDTTIVYVYIDCQDAYNKGHTASGLYTINPDGKTSFQVYCDMETDGGGWTVFQRRVDVSVDFYLNWNNYEIGFGNPLGDVWLGLSKIYRLANSYTPQELRVDLVDFSLHKAYAKYRAFYLSDAASEYKLFVAGYTGNAGDALSAHYGAKFSTKDQDHDQVGSNCAEQNHAGWWFKSCSYQSSLNGEYLSGGVTSFTGIVWYKWKSSLESCKSAEMKIRPMTKATK